MQAIETNYRGILFRSRLEARWAVFIEALGIKWRYEPEGYFLPAKKKGDPPIAYLPDFEIRAQPRFPKPVWLEVKGEWSARDTRKAQSLADESGIRVVELGEVPFVRTGYDFPFLENACFFPRQGVDFNYLFCECPFCGAFGVEFDGRSARIGCGCKQHTRIANGDKTYTPDSAALLLAYRVARFEHGECPV
jgi:hypothetical protein